uniref:DUF447 family protein n=1 Tax=Ignisphaera aggregans TaxID=334771 RepID=A0A7C4BCA6_9CREN
MNRKCKLPYLGFSSDTWGEVVVVFFSDNSVVGLMPLGLRLSEGCTLAGRLYRGSRLYDYIITTRVSELQCNVCITEEPQLFYLAIFEKDRAAKVFGKCACPKRFCDACLIGLCRFHYIEGEDVARLVVNVEKVYFRKKIPRVFVRASAALVEALVWLTKMPYMRCNESEEALKRIELLKEVVYRSTQRERYIKLIEAIYARARKLVNSSESARRRPRDEDI